MMNLFGRYVSPKIAETIWHDRQQLLEKGRIKGRKMTVTVLFTDIKDFSTISERTDPEELMEWLNEYMDAMTEVVVAHGAVIDKFIGDAIMALFGVPLERETQAQINQDAEAAVRCAIEMGKALEILNQKWRGEGRPEIAMRVGIATGTAVTGSLGGKQRMDFTAIGDTVNIAARLESYDKSLDGGICRILISDVTYTCTEGLFPAQSIGSVQLKGREEPTHVYQIGDPSALPNALTNPVTKPALF
jgi:adenylate cyclase